MLLAKCVDKNKYSQRRPQFFVDINKRENQLSSTWHLSSAWFSSRTYNIPSEHILFKPPYILYRFRIKVLLYAVSIHRKWHFPFNDMSISVSFKLSHSFLRLFCTPALSYCGEYVHIMHILSPAAHLQQHPQRPVALDTNTITKNKRLRLI